MKKKVACLLAVGLMMTASARADDKPALGVAIDDDPAGGALITSVYPGSPAALVGLMAGDRIVAIDKRSVANYREAMKIIGASAPKSTINLEVARGIWRASIPATLGNADQVLKEPAVVKPVMHYSTPAYQPHQSRPVRYGFFNRPDLSGPHYEPPPIPPVIPDPPMIVNPP